MIRAEPADLEKLLHVQPLQVDRRRAIGARLFGRWLSGHRVPKYRGYHMAREAFTRPIASARAALGMLVRSIREDDRLRPSGPRERMLKVRI